MQFAAAPVATRLRRVLPRGNTLPDESWQARHRLILLVVAAHAVIVPAFGVARGYGVLHCLSESSAITALGLVAWWAARLDQRRIASCAASLSLMTASAIVVHLAGGAMEAHFGFFVMIVLLTLYEDWVPFLAALGFVIVHHGLMGAVDPGSIYGANPTARSPWIEALIHGGYVAAAGAAGVASWKHAELSRDRALVAEREQTAEHRAVVEALREGVVLHGPDAKLRSANASAARMLDVSREVLIGASPGNHTRETLHEDGTPWDHEEYPAVVTARTGRPVHGALVGMRRQDGGLRWLELNTRPLKQEEDGWSVVTSMIDVTERKEASEELERIANHDDLTGLPNRRNLEGVLERDLALSTRHGDPAAVLVVDLDNFKYVNDSLGHAVGDEMICSVATALLRRLRASDTAARLGGDEFAVVLPRTERDDALAVAHDLAAAIRDGVAVETSDGPIRTTASIGVALMAPGDRVPELMAHADMAMYQAKDRGKDRVECFDPDTDRQEEAREGLSWAERIRTAVEHDTLMLHAQPIRALGGDERARRFELLVRMCDGSDGLVPPGVFLPVAERFDLIADIDRWVIRRAARLLAHGEADLAINLSARSIGPEMLIFLREALHEHGGDPRRLTVEITETAAISDLERAKEFAAGVRAMGCRLALDDFGAGFASFHYLKHLDFDEIKIDGEYVRDMATSETHRLVVRSLVDIAHGLGKDVTAEFVSDDETVTLLAGYGVRWGQGFHLGKPAPLGEHEADAPRVAV